MIDRKTRWQLFRYAVVGLASNIVLYFIYLGLVAAGLDPKVGMTAVYAIGVTQTFLFNRGWTFSYRNGLRAPFARYVIAYALGYIINLTVLLMLVDHLGLPHKWVQGVMIPTLAVFLFVLQKTWVFFEPADQRT